MSVTRVSAAAFFSLVLASVAGPARAASALATPEQRDVEAGAIALLTAPELARARDAVRKRFEAAPNGAGREGRAAARRAADELAYAAALAAVNGDPTRPRVTWAFTAPRRWLGHDVPGSRWGIDNPDNVYRFIPVDGTSRYELSVRAGSVRPVQFSFLVYNSFAGEGGKEKELDAPVAGLRDRDVAVGADGAFTITVDPDPAAGRPNHIQTTPAARFLLVRNTLDRWGEQSPFAVEVRRIGGPTPPPPPDRAALARNAVVFLEAGAQRLLDWTGKALLGADVTAANAVARPFTRGGGWGFASPGRWKVADDEALLVTLDRAGAAYLGFDLVDPWLVSREHVRGGGSLNDHQAVPNADGTFTYVVAAKDPGVANWADTGGIHEGQLLVRWQALPEGTASIDGAVREVRIVKLADVPGLLPAAPRVSAAQRKLAYEARARAYAHRYAEEPPAGSGGGGR